MTRINLELVISCFFRFSCNRVFFFQDVCYFLCGTFKRDKIKIKGAGPGHPHLQLSINNQSVNN